MPDTTVPAPTYSAVELIAAKRDGGTLTDAQIRWFIDRYAMDALPDYQMAAMAMAIHFQGLDTAETRAWTDAMLRSGDVLDLAHLGPTRVDKHSTGGVGDKISLPLAPAAAACGCVVPMVSGRGLGHTGGTIDKLEAIPGYSADLTIEQFDQILSDVGCAIIGQTARLAPADKRLYALRDVTATVPPIPLIVGSIMSKKLAEGIEGLVLDVKVGRGAFMKTVEQATELAQAMVDIGEAMGKRVVAFLTRMEEPLGRMVGNAVEVAESLDVLRGGGPSDVRELVVTLGGAMCELAYPGEVDEAVGRAMIARALDDGTALDRFERMIRAQGGDIAGLPGIGDTTTVEALEDGFVASIDSLEVGLTGVALGAGRAKAGDVVDPRVGIRIDATRGTRVAKGEPLATIVHGASGAPPLPLVQRLRGAFDVVADELPAAPLILGRIG